METLAPRGFTLIELLVVIAIIAIISVVVILVLNPAELLRQSRDSNRISDLSVARSAISFYLSTAASPSIGTSTCYMGAPVGSATGTLAACQVFFPSAQATTTASSTKVDGTGWIPINFMTISTGGSPISNLPKDPLNNDQIHFYAYIASSTQLTFKLDAHLESSKYGNGGSSDAVSKDGGVDPNSYEQGTNLGL